MQEAHLLGPTVGKHSPLAWPGGCHLRQDLGPKWACGSLGCGVHSSSIPEDKCRPDVAPTKEDV
eukprot:2066100-Pyramimonas_sp.AAC.1